MAARDVLIRLKADPSGLIAGVDKARHRLNAFDADLQKNASRREAINGVGNAFGAVGLAAAAGLGASVKAAMDWETSWAGVTKTVEGSAQEMAVIEQQLRDMATSMPATHAEIAAVAQAAGALGVATPDVAKFTETMVMLGEATDDLTADQAATSMAQFMNVMQTSPENVDNLANALVRLGNNGASTEGQILQMAQNLAGAGATVGLAESEVFGIANALASVGIEAEAGGSAVSKILIDMSKAAATGSPKLKTWASVADMSVKQFKDMVDNSPAEAFDVFTKGLGEINDAGGDVFSILSELGQSDIRVTRALLGMANAGDLLSDSLEMGADAFANGTDAQDEYAKRSETAAAQLQVAWNGIKDNLIDIGASALPVVKDFTNVVKDLTGAFSDLPDGVKGSVAQFLALTAAVGAGGFAVSRAITGYANLAQTINDLTGSGERLTRGQLFRRGGALAGGLALSSVASEAGKANDALGVLASAGGGALLGFGVGGPIGAAIGGTGGGLIGLLGQLTSSSDAAKEAQMRLAEAGAVVAETLDQQTGAITEATEAEMRRTLAEQGVLMEAQKMGLNLNDVTQAALGDEEAQRRVNAATREYVEIREQAVSQAQRDRQGVSEAGFEDPAKLEEASNRLQAARKALENAENGARAIRDGVGATSGEIADKQREISEFNQVAYDAAGAFGAQARGLAEAAGGVNKYAGALGEVPAKVATDVETNGAQASQQSIKTLARLYDMTPEQVRTVLAAQDLASGKLRVVNGQLIDLDGKVVTSKINVQAAQAKAAADSVLSSLRGILPFYNTTIRTTRETVERVSRDRGQTRQANGSVLDFYADGGMRENHVAQIAPAGSWRVWAEPETGGEAYIPLAESKRRRSLEIWAQTGRRLGVEGYANGGVLGGPAGSGGGVSASLVGARARLVGSDLIEFVDGRVALGIASEANFEGRQRRSGRRRG